MWMEPPELDEARADEDDTCSPRGELAEPDDSHEQEDAAGCDQQSRGLRVGHRAKRCEPSRCRFGGEEDGRLSIAEERGAGALRWIEEQMIASGTAPRDHLRHRVE